MDKITLLRSSKEEHGAMQRRVLYWYAISPAITDQKGTKIAPQAASHLPEDATRYVDAAGLAALDAGDAGFEIRVVTQSASETNTAFKNRLLADHAARESWWVGMKRDEYAQSGFSASV